MGNVDENSFLRGRRMVFFFFFFFAGTNLTRTNTLERKKKEMFDHLRPAKGLYLLWEESKKDEKT